MHNDKMVRSSVKSIEKGNQGLPGEKQASLSMKDKQLGTITKNSPFGIFGEINLDVLEDRKTSKPLNIGLAHEVKKGPAQIITDVEGEEEEKIEIELINSKKKQHP